MHSLTEIERMNLAKATKFSKKTYKMVAKVLQGYETKGYWSLSSSRLIQVLMLDFEDVFKADNTQFDQNKFRKAVHGKED